MLKVKFNSDLNKQQSSKNGDKSSRAIMIILILLLGITQKCSCNNNYLYGEACTNSKEFILSKGFLNNHLSIPDSEFSLSDSCYYLNNYNDIEIRNGELTARPSFASKFVLLKNKKFFGNFERQHTYHGTHPKNIKSILEHGLKIPDNNKFKSVHGSAYGNGIYTSKIPEYAELYADTVEFNGKYYQTVLMLKQSFGDVDEIGGFSSTLTNEQKLMSLGMIHFLHQGKIQESEIQWMTRNQDSIAVEAILVKVHDHPFMEHVKILSILIQNLN